jgi:hypothetical protein
VEAEEHPPYLLHPNSLIMSCAKGIASLYAMTCRYCSHHISPAASFSSNGKYEWEDAIIIIGLFVVQISNAAFMVFVAPLLSQGLNPLFLVCFGSLATAVFILPFAIVFERYASVF